MSVIGGKHGRARAKSSSHGMQRRKSNEGRLARSASERGIISQRSAIAHNVSFAKAMIMGFVQYNPLLLPESVGEDVVFSYLSVRDALAARATSSQLKNWAELGLSRRLDVGLETGCENLDAQALGRVLEICTSMRSLSLRGCAELQLPKEVSQQISGLLCSLEVLEVCECELLKPAETAPMSLVLRECTSLRKLKSDQLCNESLGVLGDAAGRTLETLSCRNSGVKVGNEGLISLASHCVKLRVLDISGCGVGDDGLEGLTSSPEICDTLQSLDISICTETGVKYSEDRLGETLQKLHGLVNLHLGGVFPTCSLFLALGSYVGYGSDGVRISENNKKIVKRAPFEHLKFGSVPTVESLDVFQEFIRACGQTLRVLELRGCRDLNEVALCEIANTCPHLEELCLDGCDGVTDFVLGALGNSLCQLEKLSVRRCDRVTDLGVGNLVAHSKGLTFLDLSGCTKITNRSIQSLASLEQLETLLMFCCSSISDGAFSNVTGRSPFFKSLRTLDVSWCFRVTISCCIELAKSFTSLRCLRLEGFEHFTETDMSCLKAEAPRMAVEGHPMKQEKSNTPGPMLTGGARRRSTSLHKDVTKTRLARSRSFTEGCDREEVASSIPRPKCNKIKRKGQRCKNRRVLIPRYSCSSVSSVTHMDEFVPVSPAINRRHSVSESDQFAPPVIHRRHSISESPSSPKPFFTDKGASPINNWDDIDGTSGFRRSPGYRSPRLWGDRPEDFVRQNAFAVP